MEFFHTFEYYDPFHQVTLGGRSRIITIELSKLGKIIKKPIKEMNSQELWAVYFRYLTDKRKRCKINEIVEQEEGIAMASEVLMTISKDEAERFRLMSEEKYQLDMQSKLAYARQQAIKKGMEKGIEKGIEKGMKKIIELLKSGKTPDEIISEYD